jgi:hypothetical protein
MNELWEKETSLKTGLAISKLRYNRCEGEKFSEN